MTDRQTELPTDRQANRPRYSVDSRSIYVGLRTVRSTAMQPKDKSRFTDSILWCLSVDVFRCGAEGHEAHYHYYLYDDHCHNEYDGFY